jgi:hypothetical protein
MWICLHVIANLKVVVTEASLPLVIRCVPALSGVVDFNEIGSIQGKGLQS